MKAIFYPALIFILFSSCTHKYGITKAKAFTRQTVAGTIPVDEQGRPLRSGINTQHLIFVERDTAEAKPLFDLAWVQQQPYTIRPVALQEALPLGKNMEGKEITLQPKTGRQWWQLVLTPADGKNTPSAAVKEKWGQKPVVLTGTWQESPFVYTISKQEQLQTEHYQ